MSKQIKLFLAACLYYGGLVQLLRWWIQRSGQRLIILNYHRATGGDLRRHLLYLRRHYRLLHLEEALQELYMPSKQWKQLRDRRTPLVLTFDDGYHDNYTYAFALVRELQVPITIFLIPGYMGSGNCFWWLQANHLVRHARVDKVTIGGRAYHLGLPEERTALVQTIDARVRYATSVIEREEYLARVREALAVPLSVDAQEAVLTLKWAEVREMEESGLVSFGAHTMHHPILACLRDAAEVQREVSDCRTVMEQQLGHPVRIFAYPIGRSEHIGEKGLQAVREGGYDWAVTAIRGINTPQRDPHQLRRIPTGVDRHWLIMAAETVGVWQFLSAPLKRSMIGGRRESNLAMSTSDVRISANSQNSKRLGDVIQ
jgi:peptidoglycan/xylan/chitin deacetylase (PgdA/CDA1 family)